jgi:hypothetical protein
MVACARWHASAAQKIVTPASSARMKGRTAPSDAAVLFAVRIYLSGAPAGRRKVEGGAECYFRGLVCPGHRTLTTRDEYWADVQLHIEFARHERYGRDRAATAASSFMAATKSTRARQLRAPDVSRMDRRPPSDGQTATAGNASARPAVARPTDIIFNGRASRMAAGVSPLSSPSAHMVCARRITPSCSASTRIRASEVRAAPEKGTSRC